MFVFMTIEPAESNLQHFRLNIFASYFLSYIKRIIIHYSFKIASSFTALYSLFFPFPAVCPLTCQRDAETLYIERLPMTSQNNFRLFYLEHQHGAPWLLLY